MSVAPADIHRKSRLSYLDMSPTSERVLRDDARGYVAINVDEPHVFDPDIVVAHQLRGLHLAVTALR